MVSREVDDTHGAGLLAGLGQAAEASAAVGSDGSTAGKWQGTSVAGGGGPMRPITDISAKAAAEADAATERFLAGGAADKGVDDRRDETAMRFVTTDTGSLDLGVQIRAAMRAAPAATVGSASGWGAEHGTAVQEASDLELGGGAGVGPSASARVMDLRDKGGSSRASLERGPYCSCMGTLHALWTNCLSCGKVLCEREAGRFCSSCGTSLSHISPSKAQVLDARERASVVTEHHSDILLREHASASQGILGGGAGASAVLSGSAPLAFAARPAGEGEGEGISALEKASRSTDPLGIHKG